ncbi:MAG: class I tRNA ligase family protein [Planctomycetaceae bacterium]|jgi:valyl-tRNA synthetase|nr:class I tRNA ligase family protein [Planctomycetaceae bacterium]
MNEPSTEIPKQYNPAAAQEKWATFWDEKNLFHSQPNPNKKPFCVVIPPPNVTGALHLGHALNNTLQDITVRMKRMQGFETLWIPGVDHAGIATQAVVERRLFEEEKLTRHDIGRNALIQRIWNWKEQYQTRIISQLKGMGCSCDWSRTRFTLDERCAKAVRHFFFKLFEQKLIYRGKRLVNWDTHLQTAVSDDEVRHETVAGNFWYIKYPVIEPQSGEPEYVVVATTRPETMLGDTAIAVHPDPETALHKVINDLKKRLDTAPEKEKNDLKKELDETENRLYSSDKCNNNLEHLKTLARMATEKRHVMLPLANRPIPLITDIWAKPEKGTGCVKITPAHDPNDYEVGKRQALPIINILNKNGTLNENTGKYAGLNIKQARATVVDDLEEQGLLVSVEERIIELAHSDRSKTPIEPFLNDQWFVKMEELAQNAIDTVNNGEIKIIPERYKKGYIDWLREKRDWPIGRQLWWGHRIPIWYCYGASETELKNAFAGRNDISWQWDSENNVWWICSQTEDLSENAVTGYTIVQEEDVLDTWFSSALWTHSTLGWPEQTPELDYYYPTSVLITNRDILTLWVARMVLAGKFNTGKKPFHEVFIHPKILDKYGEGMSKSKGNGIDPISVIAKFGADALRFALAYLTTENQDIRLMLDFECPYCGAIVEQTKKNRTLPKIVCPKCGVAFRTQWAETETDKMLAEGPMLGERFEVARNFCNKIWNAARFVLLTLQETPIQTQHNGNCELQDQDQIQNQIQNQDRENKNSKQQFHHVCFSDLYFLEDRWILSRLATVTKSVTESLETYRYADAMRLLYDFAWDEFCSFYVEMVKSRLADDIQKRHAQIMLIHVLNTLLRLLHPVVPFVTEEIWQRLHLAVSGVADDGFCNNNNNNNNNNNCNIDFVESIAIASWPVADECMMNTDIEKQFRVFQELLRAVRDVRASRNVPPKTEITFSVRCDTPTATLLKPMESYFLSMAKAKVTGWGETVKAPALSSTVPLAGMDVYVDLSDLIDVTAEITKLEKEIAKLDGFIKSKESKLNSDFSNKAPSTVVEKERQSLAELQEQKQSAIDALTKLKTVTSG